ncbi:MAG TPA: hypothetical protein VJO33_12140, partial [Gemmatimonadaceae bacterium]|nr:hypothetical protein [Gemmatimonadaceae bacterium]
ATCLFCHQSLGANESIEHFPVGRRLAFDAAQGRLWVICSACVRWNLTPLEERWEAIEECERLFRGQRLRAQTDQIGLAKLRDGLTLVRIGEPLRPEFAAWRYGDVFKARFRRRLGWIAGGVAVAGTGMAIGLATGVFTTGLVVLPPAWLGAIAYNYVKLFRDNLRAIHVPREKGRPYTVFRSQIAETDLTPGALPGEWILNFRHALGLEPLTSHAARPALGILMTRVNSVGALGDTTRNAAERIASAGGPESYVSRLAAISHDRAGDYLEKRARFRKYGTVQTDHRIELQLRGTHMGPTNEGALPQLSVEERLALEMAVHEEDERRALEEEIAPLEAAWRDAEEVAAIADSLLTPPETDNFIRRHRSKH